MFGATSHMSSLVEISSVRGCVRRVRWLVSSGTGSDGTLVIAHPVYPCELGRLVCELDLKHISTTDGVDLVSVAAFSSKEAEGRKRRNGI